MPHVVPPPIAGGSPPPQYSPPTGTPIPLTNTETPYLQALLTHKLRLIPLHHIPALTLTDVHLRTPHTHLQNIPPDINLAFLLRNRSTIDQHACIPQKENLSQELDITRAIWFYRLNPVHQFQRCHDAARWGIAVYVALLTQHAISQRNKHDDDVHGVHAGHARLDVSPAAIRFMSMYLSAVLEQHNAPTVFYAREAFVRLWRGSRLELFVVERSWARKALQRRMKRLSKLWAEELEGLRQTMGDREFGDAVGRFVGCLVPGRADWVPVRRDGVGGARDSGERAMGDVDVEMRGAEGENDLLEALRVPCPLVTSDQSVVKAESDEEGTTVCDLRTAINCVQEMKPHDILRELMRLFPPVKEQE